jgi:hypothetical protein
VIGTSQQTRDKPVEIFGSLVTNRTRCSPQIKSHKYTRHVSEYNIKVEHTEQDVKVGPRAALDAVEKKKKLCPCWGQNSDSPVTQAVT